MPHVFVMRYRPNFRGDGITGVGVFVGTSVVMSTVATTDVTTTESTSDAGIAVGPDTDFQGSRVWRMLRIT